MAKIKTSTRAMVTGGASGIGFQIAAALKQRGANVLLVDLHAHALENAANQLAALPGTGQIETHAADVRDVEALKQVRDHIVQAWGGIDIVVNNAGTTHYGTFDSFDIESIRRVIDVNLMGVIHGCHVFLPLLKAQGSGHIVNMASMAAISGIPRQSTYCASKAGVRALSESLRAELLGDGIGVSWMVAGTIATPFLENSGTNDSKTTQALSRMMQVGGVKPEYVAERLLRAVERNEGEVRISPDCEVYYQANRISPKGLRFAMNALHRSAVFAEKRAEKRAK